jgi:hypothetical protein
MNDIGAGFASLFGMELAAGREFTAADDDAGPRVAVVNEAFVARFGLESGAVGRRLGLDGPDGPLDTEIVGVVRNAVYSNVKAGHVPVFYLPWRQTDDGSALSLYVKSTRPADEVVAGIRNVVREVDPALPVEGLRTMREQAGLTALADRMIGRLSAAFAILATALATLGLYGVMAFSVAARTREIGLRMALGASVGRVRRLIVAQASAPLSIGGTAGLLLAFGIAKASEAILYQVRALDPLSFAGGIVMLTLAALVSAWVPAHRASRVDPMVALRAE